MRKIEKEYRIEFLIFRLFLKYVKEERLYHKFRGSVGLTRGREKDLIYAIRTSLDHNYKSVGLHRLSKYNSPFVYCRGIKELLEAMRVHNGGKIMVNKGDTDCQMKIMFAINNLIHNCLEYAIDHSQFNLLEKIGKSVFDEVCHTVFGDDFIDKTEEGMKKNFGKIKSFDLSNLKDGVLEVPKEFIEKMVKQGLLYDIPYFSKHNEWEDSPYGEVNAIFYNEFPLNE